VEGKARGDVQQSVSQLFGLGLLKLAAEQQRLGPDDQVTREHHDLKPCLVEREVAEGELPKAGCPCRRGCGPRRGRAGGGGARSPYVWVGRAGQDSLEVVAVVVGEGELRAGVRTFAADDHRERSGQEPRSRLSVISTTCPFCRAEPSWSDPGTQASSGV
jgi:hypothetical protein